MLLLLAIQCLAWIFANSREFIKTLLVAIIYNGSYMPQGVNAHATA